MPIIERNPISPGGWNHLAYSLLKPGGYEEATTVMYCALQLKPENTVFLGNLIEIRTQQRGKNQSIACKIYKCPL